MTQKSRQILLLLLWICLGTIFRFLNLDALPPWTDECATIAFSLGNSFQIIPLNEIINPEVLLTPLTPDPTATVSDVVHHLLTESTHPPVYFVLAHWWMKLFYPLEGQKLIWVARSLSAFFGVIAIPAIYFCTKLAVNSPFVAQISAAIMALSPFAIYLAREARHYTLGILLVIASLSCLIKAIQLLDKRAALPFWICLTWISINSLGIATHFFFSLTLLAELFVFLKIGWNQFHKNKKNLLQSHWRRIFLVILGTLIGCLVWLPILASIYHSPLTQWVADGEPRINWLEPILRIFLWWLSMLILLPTAFNNLSLWIVVISGIITLTFVIFISAKLISGFKLFAQNQENRLVIQALINHICGATALFLLFTYGLAMDLTLAPRFQ
ncbi:MAG: glycosyltransferase family 39 protein, partial [Oscillatoria sp. PMC 1076.18]|nr:glycosyltransferase family 39 protein [Oscillatoria sp. PMC 1076.18]